MNIYISLLESIYLWFMFTQFKTHIYFSHPLDYITSSYPFIRHETKDYSKKICPLGVCAGWIAPLWFVGRHFIQNNDLQYKINKILLATLFILSLLLNMNAFIYSIPIFILEYIQLNYSFKNYIKTI